MLNKMFNVIVISLFICSCTPQKQIQIHAELPSLTFSQFRLFLFQPAYISEQLIVVELGTDLPRNAIRDTVYILDYGLQWHKSVIVGRDTMHGCDHNRFYYAYKNIDNLNPDSVLIFSTRQFKITGVVYHNLPITDSELRSKILAKINKSALYNVFKIDSKSMRRCNNNPDTILTKLASIKDTIFQYKIDCTAGEDGGIKGNILTAIIKFQNDTVEILHKYYTQYDDIYAGKSDGYIGYHWVTDLDNDGILEIKYSVFNGGGLSWKYIGQLISNKLTQVFFMFKTIDTICDQYPERDSLFTK